MGKCSRSFTAAWEWNGKVKKSFGLWDGMGVQDFLTGRHRGKGQEHVGNMVGKSVGNVVKKPIRRDHSVGKLIM